jgi:hypothetical protein
MIRCLLLCALLGACATPGDRADALARKAGFDRQVERGKDFRHVVYRNRATSTDGSLHVYIEGDGTPYWQPDMVAVDPTPRNTLMLRLMALDPVRSIYLGRPCYFALYDDRGCNAVFWTTRRYGPEVLDSMDAVLRAEIARAGATQVELFGHSGGATLAVLLAQRVPAVTRVITLGANLDIAAWTHLHHYGALSGSINPAEETPRRHDLRTLHLVGAMDVNTPPSLVLAAARERGNEPVRVIARFNHVCCWESVWQNVLDDRSIPGEILVPGSEKELR